MAAPVATSSTNLSNEGATGITAVNLVLRIARRVADFPYEDVVTNNLLVGGNSATVGTDATTRYKVGDVLDWAEDGTFNAEIVSAISATALTLQTPRGAYGTTAAAHDGSTTPKRFRRNPRFLSHFINEIATETLNQLWPNIYLIRDSVYDIPATPYVEDFAAPAATHRIVDAYQFDTGATPDAIHPLRFGQPTQADATNFTTNIRFKLKNISASAGTIHVLNVTPVTLSTLTSRQIDIIVMEAAAALLEAEYSRPSKPAADNARVPFEDGKARNLRRMAKELRKVEQQRLMSFLPETQRAHISSRVR